MFKLFIIPIIIGWVLASQIQVQSSLHPQLHYHTLPIYGNASLGYFYVKLFIGGPTSQSQSVIIDTGSGILAIPCSQCTNCGKKHIDPPYDPSKSQASTSLMCVNIQQFQDSQIPYCRKACKGSQSKNEHCPFSIFYAEGSSLQGFMIEDDLKFENYSKSQEIRTFFGCTTKETNLFLTQEANGIFGLAPKRDSDLFDRMVERHSKYTGQHLQFSLCLSFNGGVMTVGAPNQKLHDSKSRVTVPYSQAQNLYSLMNVTEIRIGSEVLHWGTKNYGKYGIFIDSGSTFTYFPRDVYSKFENALNKKCQNSEKCKILKGQDTKCYKLQADPERLSEAVSDFFPPFFFQINGVEVPWESKKYMLTRNVKNGEVCLGVLGLDRYLLGANWMYNRDIIFDLQKKEVTIYDNVQCIEESPDMGVYSEDPKDDLNETTFSSPKIVLQIIGLVCLVLSLLVCGLLSLINRNSKKHSQINPEDSKVETQNEESSLMENKQEQKNEVEKIQMEEETD